MVRNLKGWLSDLKEKKDALLDAMQGTREPALPGTELSESAFCLRHFLGADTDQYTFEALRLFLLGAIRRAFCPGCKFEVMLCLVGGQGAGKSTRL